MPLAHPDVRERERRVCRRLAEDELGVRSYGGLHHLRVPEVHEAERHPEVGKHHPGRAVCASVRALRDHAVVAFFFFEPFVVAVRGSSVRPMQKEVQERVRLKQSCQEKCKYISQRMGVPL